jgi:DNA-binding protein H-NS
VIPSALIRQRREMHRRIRQVVAERRREMAQATADTEVTQEIPPVESTR